MNFQVIVITILTINAVLLFVNCDYKFELSYGEVNKTGTVFLKIKRGNTEVLDGIFGNNILTTHNITSCGYNCFESNSHKLYIKNKTDEKDIWDIEWVAPNSSVTITDCFDLGNYQWFGGPEQKKQYWPIQKLKLSHYSMVTKEKGNCAINERYWLSESGVYILIDPKTPLFVDQQNLEKNKVCFIAKNSKPYLQRNKLTFKYTIVLRKNARQAHRNAVIKFLNKPSAIPDERMIKYPIWSTWARYKRNINDTTVEAFANEIIKYNFSNSQIEIDDHWETCYGDLDFDTNKFPDPKNLVDRLKEKGFRVTLWVHPFINKNCIESYNTAKNNNYFVKNEAESVNTRWWNSVLKTAGLIDFSNEEAKKWWLGKLNNIRTKYGIDGFKCDAGETSWAPQIPMMTGDAELQPNLLTVEYVKACATLGGITEIRTGFRTQYLPVFVRMIDKDSKWGFNNGLSTVITTALQMNLNGYPFVLPDMVGGNAYFGDIITKELFIRWLQVNVFLPSIQYSIVPWDFDDETIEISRKFTNLHSQYADKIIELAKKSVKDGSPLNPPIWWIAPDDTEALKIDDEFLLGETILVAPVVQKAATARDIYLPAGLWYDENNNKNLSGAIWIKNYSAPLDILPYFIKIGE